MNWYVAAKQQDWGRDVRDGLELIGETVIARWLDARKFGAGQQTDAERTIAAHACFDDCMAVDALVIVAEPDLRPCKGGKHVEAGIVLGRSRQVHVIGPRENIFGWLEGRVIVHPDKQAFLEHVRRQRSFRGTFGIESGCGGVCLFCKSGQFSRCIKNQKCACSGYCQCK